MNRIKYAEQLYALISMCLGCAFIVFGLLSFIGILQPTSTSIVQSQRNIGIVFSVLGVAFLIAQAIFTALASAKKKSYYELISNGIKVNGIVEKVYMQKFLQYGKKSPYRVLYSYTYGGKIYHHKSHLLWDKPYTPMAADSSLSRWCRSPATPFIWSLTAMPRGSRPFIS